MTTELDTLLRAAPGKGLIRACLMGLTPRCNRCGGSGHYSFNQVDGTRCYGCNGAGYQKPTTRQMPEVLKAAKEAAVNGALDAYLDRLTQVRRAKQGRGLAMSAWIATGISSTYSWEKAAHHMKNPQPETQQDFDLSEINKKMARAYESVARLKGAPEEAALVDAALTTIAEADAEFKTYQEKREFK